MQCLPCSHRLQYQRHGDKIRAQAKKWAHEHPEENRRRAALHARKPAGRDTIRRWQERNPEKIKRYAEAARKRYPERRRSRWLAGNAVKAGKIKKGPCEVCGSEKVQAHHDDYSKPLDVRWLCPKHHGELSRRHK